MPRFECTKCGRIYAGWSNDETCPDCGGRLIEIKQEGDSEGSDSE